MFMVRLKHDHPNFFIVYLAVAWVWGVGSLTSIVGHHTLYDTMILTEVNKFGHHHHWGWAMLAVACLMVGGLFRRTFHIARVGLALGTILAVTRAFFVILSLVVNDGSGIMTAPMWVFFAVVHVALTTEPTQNPMASRAAR